jgi:hypothetical protein
MSLTLPNRAFFHVGYLVRNLAAVMENMGKQFGVTSWKVLQLPEGSPATAMGFAYAGDAMIEMIEVDPEGELLPIHRGFAPRSNGEARLNHLAYLVESEDELGALIASFEAAGVTTAWVDSFGDIFSRYYYADTTAQLGHFSEFVCLGPAGRDFLADIPRN